MGKDDGGENNQIQMKGENSLEKREEKFSEKELGTKISYYYTKRLKD